MAKSMLEMLIGTEEAKPDATLTAIDVFEEKSQDADTAIEFGMGLSQEEIFEIATSVTPMGAIGKEKGALSFLKGLLERANLKGLLERAKSKYKFPVGYGEPTKNIPKNKTLDQQLFELKWQGKMLDKVTKEASKHLAKDQKAIDESIKRMKSLDKPKGIRQFGKFNRQKWEK
jgi:alkylhydroperoxidase/carboxymuconolactone decarboxylase family protein YurZ